MEFSKIKKIIAEQLGVSETKIKEDSRLVEDLGADSLDMVEMLMTFEEEYSMTIDDSDAVSIKTVSDIVKLLSK